MVRLPLESEVFTCEPSNTAVHYQVISGSTKRRHVEIDVRLFKEQDGIITMHTLRPESSCLTEEHADIFGIGYARQVIEGHVQSGRSPDSFWCEFFLRIARRHGAMLCAASFFRPPSHNGAHAET